MAWYGMVWYDMIRHVIRFSRLGVRLNDMRERGALHCVIGGTGRGIRIEKGMGIEIGPERYS
jgi:hypothetical protein